MSVPSKWRARLADVQAHMPRMITPDGTDAPAIERSRLTRLVAHSSVPAEHLSQAVPGGFSLAGAHGSVLGQYFPEHRGIAIFRDTMAHPLSERHEVQHMVVHEIGHAADHMLNSAQFPDPRNLRMNTSGLKGRAEAMAENYADHHTGGAAPSHYDLKIHEGNRPVIDSFGGDQEINNYKSYRAYGEVPGVHEPPLEERMAGKTRAEKLAMMDAEEARWDSANWKPYLGKGGA